MSHKTSSGSAVLLQKHGDQLGDYVAADIVDACQVNMLHPDEVTAWNVKE